MSAPSFAATVFLVLIAAINAYGLYLWNRLNNLILDTSDELEVFIGDNVARHYTQYLYKQVVGGKYSFGPNIMTIGDPESNKVVRRVKASHDFARLNALATYIRGLPINIIPFVM